MIGNEKIVIDEKLDYNEDEAQEVESSDSEYDGIEDEIEEDFLLLKKILEEKEREKDR